MVFEVVFVPPSDGRFVGFSHLDPLEVNVPFNAGVTLCPHETHRLLPSHAHGQVELSGILLEEL